MVFALRYNVAGREIWDNNGGRNYELAFARVSRPRPVPLAVGQSYAGQPAIGEGFCERCGHAYSFLPNLTEGVLVAGQYEVVGYFARGGLGWVYLARDIHLDGNLVVLKSVIDAGDAALSKAERDALIRMDHPNIVRLFNFVSHPDEHGGRPREYIVMEYVDGLVLHEVQRRAAAGLEPLGEPLRADDTLIDELAKKGIAYVPFFPLGGFSLLQSATLSAVAADLAVSPLQVALAWLLHRSPNILLIPGTSSVAHLRENLMAGEIALPADAIERLDGIAGFGGGAGATALPTQAH